MSIASNLANSITAGVQTSDPNGGGLGVKSLANTFDQKNSTCVDIARSYPWTQTKLDNRNDIPYIRLVEYRNNESILKRQAKFYSQQAFTSIKDAVNGTFSNGDASGLLSVYDEIWPTTNPTNWSYIFPYFNKTQFELTTPEWSKIDPPDLAGAGNATAGGLEKLGFKNLSTLIGGAVAVGELAMAGAELAVKAVSPQVGTVDRPRVFTEHSSRSITISFPLYNTIKQDDWKNNRDFYYRFASQNLFNKRDFITGLPPVWYTVYVPGQYYSRASSVTNFNVENLGNSRLAYGSYIVPDAYQITITLQEMLMPSLNQFQAILPNGSNQVTVK